MTLESHSPAALTGQWMAVAATASASPAPVQATAAVDNDRYRQIKELVAAHSKMVPGDVWHVVDARWAAKWKAHMKLDQRSDDDRDYPPPGPLDNSRLQGQSRTLSAYASCLTPDEGANELALSKDVVEHRDFILVHDAVWKVLIEQYSGGPDFPRSVVTVCDARTSVRLRMTSNHGYWELDRRATSCLPGIAPTYRSSYACG